jgi:hypothetical protein
MPAMAMAALQTRRAARVARPADTPCRIRCKTPGKQDDALQPRAFQQHQDTGPYGAAVPGRPRGGTAVYQSIKQNWDGKGDRPNRRFCLRACLRQTEQQAAGWQLGDQQRCQAKNLHERTGGQGAAPWIRGGADRTNDGDRQEQKENAGARKLGGNPAYRGTGRAGAGLCAGAHAATLLAGADPSSAR